MILLLACAAPAPTAPADAAPTATAPAPTAPATAAPTAAPTPAPAAAPTTQGPPAKLPPELLGDWYLTDPYQGRRVVALPCASKLSHMVLQDTPTGPRVAARRVQAVYLGNVDAITGGDGTWVFDMGDSPDWTMSLLDPTHRLLRWTGKDPALAGPWVREADLDAYEYLALPESECKRADPVPTLPPDLPTGWWPLLYDGAWHAAPGAGTTPSLELLAENGLTVVRRSGKGEERWPVLRLDTASDRLDFTLRTPDGGFAGMRLMKRRPAPPPLDVGADPTAAPTPAEVPPAAGDTLPAGAWYLSLPGRPAYTAGAWAPATTLTKLAR